MTAALAEMAGFIEPATNFETKLKLEQQTRPNSVSIPMPQENIIVLLIEDDLDHARRFKNIFRRNRSKVTLIHKKHVDQGIDYLTKHQVDVVLLDLTWPTQSAVDVVRLVCTAAPAQPVLALAEADDEDAGLEIIKAGAQDYLVKNYMGHNSLNRVIRYSLERSRHRSFLPPTQPVPAPSTDDTSPPPNIQTNPANTTLSHQIAATIEEASLPQAIRRELAEYNMAGGDLQNEGEHHFRQFLASISDHIYVTKIGPDDRHENLYISPNIEIMTGYPHQRFVDDWSFWPTKVIYPADQPLAKLQATRLMTGEDHQVEYRLVRADGRIIWVRDSGRVEIQGNAKIIYGVVSDITERKRAELEREHLTQELQSINQTLDERVRARTAELQAILDAVGEGVVVTDLAGTIQYINPAVEKLTGYSQEESLSRRPNLWRSGQQNHTFYAQMWQTILAGQVWRGELKNKRKDGSLFDVQLTITPILGPDQKPRGFVGVQSDITPLKKMDRLKSEFLSTAAHELRTPLTSIQGFSEILLTRDLKEEQHTRYLTFINQQATALAAIINDLLDLTRLESGQSFEMVKAEVDLQLVVDEVLFGFRENHPEHQYYKFGPDTWPLIEGDRVKLAQLFKNLYSNATKYSPQGGEVTLIATVQTEYNLLHLALSDEGIGMTEEQLSRIFDRFYRADASNTAIGGTGLGMSISQLIVEQHNGKIWLESQPGAGTTVYILLPLKDRPAYILVIEDDDKLMEMERTILEYEGFNVMTATEGKKGLKLAQSGAPDLILLDLNLPGMSGFTILENLRQNLVTQRTPVLITSAMDTPEHIEKAIEKGATDYLVKPYSVGDLLVRINRALAQASS